MLGFIRTQMPTGLKCVFWQTFCVITFCVYISGIGLYYMQYSVTSNLIISCICNSLWLRVEMLFCNKLFSLSKSNTGTGKLVEIPAALLSL